MRKLIHFLAVFLCLLLCFGVAACDDGGSDDGGGGGDQTDTPVKIETEFDMNNEAHINWFGRTYANETKDEHWFNHTASGFEVNFYGTELTAVLKATMYGSVPNSPVLGVYVDGENDPFKAEVLHLIQETTTIKLVDNLTDGLHTVKVLKRSETQQSQNALISLQTDGEFYTPPKKPKRKLEFYGDSITCGYGITATDDNFNTLAEDGTATYAAIAAMMLNAQYNVISGSGMGLYRSPYQTTTIPDVFKQIDFDNKTMWNFDYIPDAIIINLGTNDNSYIDSLYNKADKEDALAEYQAAYKRFVENLNKFYPSTPIVAVYNMMASANAIIHRDFEEFIDGLNDEGLPVTALRLTSMYDDSEDIKLFHPGYATHKKSGDVLAQYLKELLAW